MINSKRIIGTIAMTALSSAVVFSSAFAEEGRREMKEGMEQDVKEMRQDVKQMKKDYQQERKEDKYKMKDEIKDNKKEIKDNRKEFRADYGPFTPYAKADITEEEKVAIKAILDAHKKYMDEMMKTQKEMMSSGSVSEEKKAEWAGLAKAAIDKLITDLTPYVDPAKIEDFKKALGARQDVVRENQELRKENKDIRKEYNNEMKDKREEFRGEMKDKKEEMKQSIKAQKAVLSEKAKTSLSVKLDSVPTEKKEAFYTALLAKIDAALAKVQNSKTKAQLTEMRAIVQEKLDALTSTDDESLINEILSDTPAQ